MSIRPVDMQIATLRALDHPEAKQNVLHRADIAHDSSNAALEKSEIRKRSSVNELEKGSQSRMVREEEQRGSKGRQGGGQNPKREKQRLVDEKGEVIEVAHIDIKI